MKKRLLYYVGMSAMSLALMGCKGENATDPEKEPSLTVTQGAQKEGEEVSPTPMVLVEEDTTGTPPAIKDVYQELFSIGVAVGTHDVLQEYKLDVILQQFNSMTCGNEMKADSLLDRRATLESGTEESPVINFSRADIILSFAQEHGIAMRGHTLVWHSQVPRWFFTVKYSDDASAPFVTKEVMLSRMDSYIRQVMEYTNETYPGVIYAWDVVNEAIETGDGHERGLRTKDSLWYQVIGEEYIEKAFEYARAYAAEGQTLFYNDYNEFVLKKRFAIINLVKDLKEKGLIDGIGMQSHLQMSDPSLIDYEETLKKYGELGLEIQVTELDVDALDNSEETQAKLAKRYKQLFYTYKRLKESGEANITNITIWGLSDDGSWLNDETASYPVLFTQLLEAKPAFYGAIMDESIPLY